MTKVYPQDPELEEASRFSQAYRTLAAQLKSARLRPLAEAFRANLDRVGAMATILVVVAFWTDQIARVECFTRWKMSGSPDDLSKDRTPEMQAALAKSFDSLVVRRREEMGHRGADQDTWSKGLQALSPVIGVAFSNEDLANTSDFPVVRGVQSIFGSMVSLAYAAFEALAIDLWVEAVNADTSLAKAWFAAKQNQNKNKQYPISDLLDYDFNLTGKTGSWMQEKEIATFSSSDHIRSAYSCAFGNEISDCFDEGLKTTEQVRHSLAHRGGLIEKRFLRAVPDHPIYSKVKIGDRLPLDGSLVRDHVDSCISSMVALLLFVDKHLSGKGLA